MGLFSGVLQFVGAGSWNSFRDNYVTGIGVIRHLGFMKKPISPNYGAQSSGSSGSSRVFKAATAPHQLIYGQMRVSGMKYEIGSSGANNEYLHMIIVLAGHELDSIGNIIVNNVLVDGTPATALERTSIANFKNHILVTRHLGGAGQVADPTLLAAFPAWTAAHTGDGIAYVAIRIKYSVDLFPNGVENIKCDVRGKKIFDPRTGNTAWSDNWALCVRDYLTAEYGVGLLNSEVNDTFTNASADISAEIIATANGGSQNRYTINGTVDLSKKPVDNLKKLLTAGAGHVVPVMEGQARIIAGAYAVPTQTIGVSDLRADITYSPHQSISALFNEVSGQYAGEDSLWVKATYPQVGDQAAINADGRTIRKVIDLPYCTDHERCQRLSKLVLNQHRSGATLKMPCKATVKDVATMDVVLVDLPDLFGATPRTFRVMDFTSNADLTVDLMLEADNSTDYAWQQSDATPFVPVPAALTNTSPAIVQPGIPVRVNGLELAGQGNNTEFTGPDAHFVWRHTTVYDFQNIGSEIFGAGSGGFDAWFMGYEIIIKDSTDIVVHRAFTADNFFDFTMAKNAISQGGPHRAFSIEVRIKGKQNQLSKPAMLSVSNPLPQLALMNASVSASFNALTVKIDAPVDLDYAGLHIYLGAASGFTPSPANLVYSGPDTLILLPNLAPNTNYFLRLSPYDGFGDPGFVDALELSASTTLLGTADIALNSVTDTTSVTDNTTRLFAASGAFADVISTTHISNGGAVTIDGGLIADRDFNVAPITGGYKIQILRGVKVIYETPAAQIMTVLYSGVAGQSLDFFNALFGTTHPSMIPWAGSVIDRPGIGQFTYTIQILAVDDALVTAVHLNATELLR